MPTCWSSNRSPVPPRHLNNQEKWSWCRPQQQQRGGAGKVWGQHSSLPWLGPGCTMYLLQGSAVYGAADTRCSSAVSYLTLSRCHTMQHRPSCCELRCLYLQLIQTETPTAACYNANAMLHALSFDSDILTLHVDEALGLSSSLEL